MRGVLLEKAKMMTDQRVRLCKNGPVFCWVENRPKAASFTGAYSSVKGCPKLELWVKKWLHYWPGKGALRVSDGGVGKGSGPSQACYMRVTPYNDIVFANLIPSCFLMAYCMVFI